VHEASPQPAASPRRWSQRSLVILVLAWLILQIGGLFTPGLLDDVDSVYIEIAREMMQRHDYVTPYINGIRFFDKPPLMYWMAAASMHLFGVHDWAARLPLALAVLALLLAVYALGIRLFAAVSPASHPDRGGFYAALAMATGIGPYLYTRFYIPDILLALWMTLAVHLFLIALDRTPEAAHNRGPQRAHLLDGVENRGPQRTHLLDEVENQGPQPAHLLVGVENRVPHLRDGLIVANRGPRQLPLTGWASVGNRDSDTLSSPSHQSSGAPSFAHFANRGPRQLRWWGGKDGNVNSSALLPCLAFAAVMALNVLTKGLIGLVFPIGFVLLYLAITKQLHLLLKLHLLASTAVFLAIAAPWHILAALRTPAIALPQGLGLPPTGGWAWFYLYNEHIARFLSRRIPHDYGLTPVWLFWIYLVLWIMPWAIFLPPAIADQIRALRNRAVATAREHEASLSLLLWTLLVLGFFTLSNRQEYYSLPALPALALMIGGILARAECTSSGIANPVTNRSALNWHLYALVPLTTLVAIVCGYFALTAPNPAPGADIVSLLAMASHSEDYNLSLSHMSDLTGAAMGFFRGPLAATAFGMLGIGLGSYLLRRKGRTYAANLALAAAMIVTLLAAHEGLARFYPILGSKSLALAINQALSNQSQHSPDDLIVLDGELTSGSTLIFYTGQQVHMINGRVNGLWYGSFWPDAPHIFETEDSLRQLWASPRRIFLFTYNPAARTKDLDPYGRVHTIASAGGKTILTNY
jgi:4-amino-4-deoxy-L-arabinose transferase-like glycosyltransferase